MSENEIKQKELEQMIAGNHAYKVKRESKSFEFYQRLDERARKELGPLVDAIDQTNERLYARMTSEEKRAAIYRLLDQKRKEKERIEAELLALHVALGDLGEGIE